jgi:hypothetical protein
MSVLTIGKPFAGVLWSQLELNGISLGIISTLPVFRLTGIFFFQSTVRRQLYVRGWLGTPLHAVRSPSILTGVAFHGRGYRHRSEFVRTADERAL